MNTLERELSEIWGAPSPSTESAATPSEDRPGSQTEYEVNFSPPSEDALPDEQGCVSAFERDTPPVTGRTVRRTPAHLPPPPFTSAAFDEPGRQAALRYRAVIDKIKGEVLHRPYEHRETLRTPQERFAEIVRQRMRLLSSIGRNYDNERGLYLVYLTQQSALMHRPLRSLTSLAASELVSCLSGARAAAEMACWLALEDNATPRCVLALRELVRCQALIARRHFSSAPDTREVHDIALDVAETLDHSLRFAGKWTLVPFALRARPPTPCSELAQAIRRARPTCSWRSWDEHFDLAHQAMALARS
jgi:hypothetical protein